MIKRLKKGRIILISIIILSLIVLVFSIIGHIQDQDIKIKAYARILQEQRMSIDQLRKANRNLENVVLNQYNEIRSIQKAETVSVNTEIPITEPIDEQEKETDGSNNKNKILLGVATAGVFVGNLMKTVGVPVLSTLR